MFTHKYGCQSANVPRSPRLSLAREDLNQHLLLSRRTFYSPVYGTSSVVGSLHLTCWTWAIVQRREQDTWDQKEKQDFEVWHCARVVTALCLEVHSWVPVSVHRPVCIFYIRLSLVKREITIAEGTQLSLLRERSLGWGKGPYHWITIMLLLAYSSWRLSLPVLAVSDPVLTLGWRVPPSPIPYPSS